VVVGHTMHGIACSSRTWAYAGCRRCSPAAQAASVQWIWHACVKPFSPCPVSLLPRTWSSLYVLQVSKAAVAALFGLAGTALSLDVHGPTQCPDSSSGSSNGGSSGRPTVSVMTPADCMPCVACAPSSKEQHTASSICAGSADIHTCMLRQSAPGPLAHTCVGNECPCVVVK
jgi:hypothetical protein